MPSGETSQSDDQREVASASCPFDRQAVIKRWGNDANLADTLIRRFQEQAAVELARLEQAVEAADTHAIHQIAHKLKGSACLIEAPGVVEPATRLEELARQGNLAALPPVFDALRKALLECAPYDKEHSARYGSQDP